MKTLSVPATGSSFRVSLGLATAGRVGPPQQTRSMPSVVRLAIGRDPFAEHGTNFRSQALALGLLLFTACVPGEFGGSPNDQDPIPPLTSPMPSPSVSTSPSPSPSPSVVPDEPVFGDHWTQEELVDSGDIDLVPIAPRDGKAPRRLSVAQLRASIPALFGGLDWTGRQNGNTVSMFTLLSRTLGEADYIGVTEENRDPNPIFAKFMDDMAGQVCAAAVLADKTATNKVITPYPTDVPRNLRFMRLKLHGVYVAEGSMDGIDELADLHANILADTSNADQAWTGVCVAMLTAPELMAY